MIVLDDKSIRVLERVSELDYFDSQTAELPCEVTPLDVWNLVISEPRPCLKLAFKVRDRISAVFGVQEIQGFSGQQVASVEVGDRLDFFLVEDVDDSVLVLTARDRHLDVMTCISTQGSAVTITSSVQVHNAFGHAYMLPVGIAHRWIVRNMLRRLQSKLSA
ncbi:DUF2867 domain-containing protein [Alloyangia pacifica]|uniref:DUF2867 domain-containing protein n=1 Tax=Alloyangia pacifica TaxID=311180 RepID=A0A1I6TRH8_9RHOB|nr:DUF2867 domain-containing protein [Alloyangia pacifica]SDH09284.1 Protein of unknown function [Alloyangia pacifica]SFS91781.1 Protein of unknown function [Alloyangia pacifica]